MAAPLVPNGLERERLALGIPTADALAQRAGIEPWLYSQLEAGAALPTAEELERLLDALDGLPADRLYVDNYLAVIGPTQPDDTSSLPEFFRRQSDRAHLLVSRGEVTWMYKNRAPDRQAEVFVNLSCSTQTVPNLLLDTVAVLTALGVDFVAAAGQLACCGKPLRRSGRQHLGERVSRTVIRRTQGWGASTHVNWCTACQITHTTAAARRDVVDGEPPVVREVQLLDFLEERVRALGSVVPWTRRVQRRVLAEGHPEWSPVHAAAQAASARLLALVPGVEVVDSYVPSAPADPCAMLAGPSRPQGLSRLETSEDVKNERARLARRVADLGADTVSCQHQYCHALWSQFAGPGLEVRHVVSVLAEALGCDHPDRYQAAIQLGDPDEFVRQTRQVWGSWGMAESRARELALEAVKPAFAAEDTRCQCGGGGGCKESLLTIDVLSGPTGRT